MKLPRDIGPIHFVGIGGIGMSGIAEVLVNLGYTVRGSDVAESANVKRLRENGIAVSVGHDAENLGAAQVVVVSTAVKKDNPEVQAARAKLIPVVRFALIRPNSRLIDWPRRFPRLQPSRRGLPPWPGERGRSARSMPPIALPSLCSRSRD